MSVKRAFFSVFQKLTLFCCAMFFGFANAFSANLPSGYTELEYIESTGTQYIDTGVKPTAQTSVSIKANLLSLADGPSFCGSLGTSGVGGVLIGTNADGDGRFYVNSTSNSISGVTIEANKIYEISVGGTTVSVQKAGESAQTFTGVTAVAANNNNISMIGRNNNGTWERSGSFRYYYMKIYNNGELVRDFVPAKNSSGVVGMYDLVSERFFGNAGSQSTNFVAGPVQRDAQCSKHGMKYVSRSLIPNISDNYASYYYAEEGRVTSYSNGVLSVTWPTGTTSNTNNGITARNMDYIGGHVYASIGYVNSDGTFNLGVGGANGLITGATDSIPATNGWQWACNRLVVTNNVNAHPNFRIMQNGKTLSISEIYLVDLTEMFGAGNEPATSEAIIAALVDNNCAAKIKIATTAYNAARFSPVQTDLNNAVATIREIVTKTINQTAAIASLQADKQTRPEDACPAGKKCLLVETEENGVIVPHWFPIIESPTD